MARRREYILALASLTLVMAGYTNCVPVSTHAVAAANGSGVGVQKVVGPPLGASPFSQDNDFFVAGRILVKAREGVSDQDLDSELSRIGGRSVHKIEGINVHVVELPSHVNEKATAALLAHNPKFAFAEVDAMFAPDFVPDDPYFGVAWHHATIGSASAWDVAQGDGVILASLDSGVDPAHPDLAPKMVAGYNFYDNNTNTSDVYGHGTKVAGAAAAIGNNGIGVVGTSPNVKLMPIRVTGTDGWAVTSYLASGITWAADHGARVASISFQVNDVSSISTAASYMRNKGGLVVNAAGNGGTEDLSANSPSLIVVSATDSGDNRPSWSTYGAPVDIAAPGVGIYCTTNGGGYTTASGTSLSTPVVAGVVADMIAANPNLSAKQLESILYSTAVDLGAAGWDPYYGNGRVNAAAAVAAARAAVVSDSIAPTVSISSPSSGSIVAGVVVVNVAASDNVGLARVELYMDGALLASGSLAPYTFSIDSLLKSDGAHSLQAKAYDTAGNMASSSLVNITIDNYPDTTPPVITSISPSNGTVVKGSVTISAKATDNEVVAGMSIYINDKLQASSSSGSISTSWNTRKIPVGTYTIRVEARDAAGNIASQTIQLIK